VEKSLPLDREDTLKKAEKLLRQGRLDAAIAEYLRVVEDQPRDWNTANTLGDLYVRANQADKAVAQYARIADHFFQDGFYPKAAALYKKILKIVPEDEKSQLHLADISIRLGLMADAKSYLTAVATRRRARGDTHGANEMVVRLGTLDPADIAPRRVSAISTSISSRRGARPTR
jgi:tetratricopeptide (TPR) repeat protein